MSRNKNRHPWDDEVEIDPDSKFDRYLYDSGTFVALEKDKSIISDNLPAGIYAAFAKESMFGVKVGFDRVKLTNDTVIELPDPTIIKVVNVVKEFWSTEASDKYKQYGVTRKLGVLLYGAPGTGKSISSVRIVKMVMDLGGIVLFNPEIHKLQTYLKVIRQIEPTKKVMILMEEFDSISDDAELLSIMDGELQLDNIFFMATTNYINKISSRLKNRRSRFAHVLELKNPNKEVREVYFNAILKEEDKSQYLASFVDATEGLSIDACKNLMLDVLVYGLSIDEAVREMKKMAKEHSMGDDDYNEKQRKELFKIESKDDNKPLRGV